MDSILTTTKRILNIGESDTSFDLDVITHINAAFSTLQQLGPGPDDGFFITDSTEKWTDIGLPAAQLHLLKTYIWAYVKMYFDPPATSYHTVSMKEQLEELKFRLNWFHEISLITAELPEDYVLDGGGP